MSGPMSRRALFGRRTAKAAPAGHRPPWSSSAFDAACDSCGDCIKACPEAILAGDAAGRPVLVLDRGGCTFCGACDVACQPREGRSAAIDRAALAEGARALPLLAELGGACISIQGVSCRLCGDPCDPRAIRFRPMVGGRVLPEISAETCTGCGVCVSACPVGAIRMAPWSRA
ncbi:Ferredoxin [Magnetospirillum sp. SS-4]|nr:Ferredoxin [Magnetospirillum sp. SS-4]